MGSERRVPNYTGEAVSSIITPMTHAPKPGGVYPVIVRWRDATKYTDYVTPNEPVTGAVIFTIGFIVREDEQGILVAGDTDGKGGFRYGMGIPKGCIIEVRSLHDHKADPPLPLDHTTHEPKAEQSP
jgi:hypothetical protein